MNRTAAAEYVDKLFGKATGHVSVAYKDRGDSWQESQFAWPKDRTKLLGWAQVHSDANVFICPALRQDAHTRKKGDGINLRWLWADVDWDKIPTDKRAIVRKRIQQVGSYIVKSGSGDNAHVYVDLGENVSVAEHLRLNTGLRDYLFADNKQADNSLLRLAGTTNWKTADGSNVIGAGGHGKRVSSARLLALRTFQRVSVMAMADSGPGGSEWALIDTSGLPRRIRSLAKMGTDEAVSKYGSRHKAVWAVTGEMHKAGLDPDMIHSLMDQFPPAIEKNEEEHNGYDVHKDVEKRLIWDRSSNPADTDDESEEMEEVGAELAEQLSLEDFEREVERRANDEYLRNMARKRAKQIEAERTWIAPPPEVSWDLPDIMDSPPPPGQYLIGIPPGGKKGLAGAKHNVIITAQFKTGKTKFVIATIAKALCDAQPFMDTVPVHTPEGGVKVGHWNCEMDPDEMASEYVIPAGIENMHNLTGANLRGHRVNLLSPMGKQWAINWLRDRQVKVWTIDSLARLARMAGVSEKDNDEMFDLLMAIDEVKVEAGVDVVFLITHTGRMQHEEGKERARGATAIDDWCDARWIMTEQSNVRFLAVDGRGVGLDTVSLVYDDVSGHSSMGMAGKAETMSDGHIQAVAKAVRDNPGITLAPLAKTMKLSQRVVSGYLDDAIAGDLVEMKHDPSGRGRAAKRYYFKELKKPENDRHRRGTPREVVIERNYRGRVR